MISRIRLGAAHELGFALAMLTSILIVLMGGELPGFAWLVCGAPFVSALLALQHRSAPASSATLVGFMSLVFGGVTIERGGVESSVLAGGEVLLGLLAARLLVRRTPGHDLQALLLSLLLVLAGSVLNVGINYIVLFVAYAVTAVWALTTRQLLAGVPEQERGLSRIRDDVVTPAFFGATALISVGVLTSAALIFALFPRVGFGDFGAFLRKESRLPDAVGLRGDPRLTGSTTVVARVRNVPRESFDRGLYLRGAIYDVITLEGFSQSKQPDGRRSLAVELSEAPVQARYEVTLMPTVGDTLLTLGGTAALRPLSGGALNPNFTVGVAGASPWDEMKAIAPLRSPLRYEVAGGIARPGYVPATPRRPPRPLDEAERLRWTATQGLVDEEIRRAIAPSLENADTPRARARAVRGFFFRNFQYSQSPPRFANAPLRTFLLEERQGHCEFFASAFALLLRSEGIPARVVGGFQGGAWDDDVVVFQERHAHAWVEWWDDEAGWIVDDATPLASAPREEMTALSSLFDRARRFWDDQVIDYSMQDQVDSLSRARRSLQGVTLATPAVAFGGALLVMAGFAFFLWARRRRRNVLALHVHPLARAIVTAVGARRSEAVPAAWTVREAVEKIPADDELGAALRGALAVYERARFGGRPADAAEVRHHLRTLREGTRRAKSPGSDR